jgi:hypothetical protein
MRQRVAIVATAALLMGLAGGAPAGAAAPSAFSSPVRVVAGTFTDLALIVDSTNHVHIAATGRQGVWYVTNRGGAWHRTRILHDLPNMSYFDPSIALDTHDRVFISVARNVCDDCTPGGSTGIYFVTDKGRARGTFPTSPTRIAPVRSAEGTLKVSNGHMFLSYVRPCCIPGPLPRVLVRTNASGTWTTRQVALHGDVPALRIGSDGRPRVSYDRAGGIYFAVAASPTGAFTTVHVPGTTSDDVGAQLALDANKRPQLTWFHDSLGTGDIRYIRRDAGGWHGPIEVTSNPNFASMAFDLDSLGRPNVALGAHTVRNLVRSGGVWHASPVATGTDVREIVERRAFNGRVVIAWGAFNGGIFVSRN